MINSKIEELEDLQYELIDENDRLKELSRYFQEEKYGNLSQSKSINVSSTQVSSPVH